MKKVFARLCAVGLFTGCGVGAAEISAQTPPSTHANASFTIGKRADSKAVTPDTWLPIAEVFAKKLGTDTAAASDSALVETIRQNKELHGAAFAKLLNPKIASEASVRKGAAIGIGISNAGSNVVSIALANSALVESNAETRKTVIATIQQRKDTVAVNSLMTTLAESTDPDGLGYTNETQRNAALSALRDIGDKRVYQALLCYVTSDVRFGSSSLVKSNPVYITNSGDVTTGAVGASSTNLPIELPIMELMSVQTTLMMPAISRPMLALQKISGEDFGKNMKKWNEWADRQPEFRK